MGKAALIAFRVSCFNATTLRYWDIGKGGSVLGRTFEDGFWCFMFLQTYQPGTALVHMRAVWSNRIGNWEAVSARLARGVLGA